MVKVQFSSKDEIFEFFNCKANQLRENENGDFSNIKLPPKLNKCEETMVRFCVMAQQKIEFLEKTLSSLKENKSGGEGGEAGGNFGGSVDGEGGTGGSNPSQARGRARVREEGERRRSEEWELPAEVKQNLSRINKRMDFLESQVDENSTRLRKGTLICSSSDANGNSLLKPIMPKAGPQDPDGKKSNQQCSLEELMKVLDLIEKKYKVKLNSADISACHWLPSGSFIIRFTNRGVNSPWHKLIEAMGEGGDRNFNLFLNFNLTRKRLALLSDVRKYKKEKKIEKYDVNQNGQISIRIHKKWMKITHHYSKDNSLIQTYSNFKLQKTVDELFNYS